MSRRSMRINTQNMFWMNKPGSQKALNQFLPGAARTADSHQARLPYPDILTLSALSSSPHAFRSHLQQSFSEELKNAGSIEEGLAYLAKAKEQLASLGDELKDRYQEYTGKELAEYRFSRLSVSTVTSSQLHKRPYEPTACP